jgi:Bacterial Ig-like domain (group 2)
MTGQADPMMHFPVLTVFTPYSVLRNLNSQAVSITSALWWMTGGAAASASLPALTLAPLQTKLLDLPGLLAAAGLKNFSGAVNLVLQFQGVPGSVIAASGSVDQSENYVFEVVPRGVGEGASKSLSYWSTANGDDTMVTLWNPADEAQDFVFTVFFAGGHYLYPIRLEPRATSMFNMSELIENQLPDSEGNVIPVSVREGSGKLSGSLAENQHILVAMDAGTYNVRKATCVFRCITCNGAVSFTVAANPFAVALSGTSQMSMKDRWNTGSTYDVTSASDWSSSNTSVATVDQTALAHGISVGGATLSAFDYSEPLGGQDCNYYPSCANDMAVGGGNSAPGNVQKPGFLQVVATAPPDNSVCQGQGCVETLWYIVLDVNQQLMKIPGMTVKEFVSAPSGTCNVLNLADSQTWTTDATGALTPNLCMEFDQLEGC